MAFRTRYCPISTKRHTHSKPHHLQDILLKRVQDKNRSTTESSEPDRKFSSILLFQYILLGLFLPDTCDNWEFFHQIRSLLSLVFHIVPCGNHTTAVQASDL